MAKTSSKKTKSGAKRKGSSAQKPERRIRPFRWVLRWLFRAALVAAALLFLAVLSYRIFNPPTTIYMAQESRRLGGVDYQWVDADEIAPVMLRSAVAAEDANFCAHWGFDMDAIRDALEDGANRGASTISQQVVKNAYLWHGRSWSRKALEALITPMMEGVWHKRRILEVYLNIAEFDEGIFGVEAASRHYFRVGPDELTAVQAARLAAILPAPKSRSAANPSAYVRRRAASIMDGAETIHRDGRAGCFE